MKKEPRVIGRNVTDKEVEDMTPYQYAQHYGCKPQYIHWLLKNERLDLMPEVVRVRKYSRFYILEVKTRNTQKKSLGDSEGTKQNI